MTILLPRMSNPSPIENSDVTAWKLHTSYGRICFNRLLFGIMSAPEHFQWRIAEIVEGMEGVLYMMDDILVFGASQEEHDERLRKVLQRLQTAN